MVRVSWVRSLHKDELQEYAVEFGIDADGTVDELRKRLSSFVSKEHHDESVIKRLEELESKHWRESSPNSPGGASVVPDMMPISIQVPTGTIPRFKASENEMVGNNKPAVVPIHPEYSHTFMQPTEAAGILNANMALMDRVRKWGVKYNGNGNPLTFIERVEELIDTYGVNANLVPRAMPELLQDRALQWYRSNNRRWEQWGSFKIDFLKFFLAPRFFERLEDDVRQRHQGKDEHFRDYVLAIQGLMRHADMNDQQQLERIYRNSSRDVQLYIKRKEFTTLNELLELVGDLENLNPDEHVTKEVPPKQQVVKHRQLVEAENDTPIDVAKACRRCGQNGHFARYCRNATVIYCWKCGRRGVFTRKCCDKKQGNESSLRKSGGNVKTTKTQPKLRHMRFQDQRIVATVALGECLMDATIDTGAGRSFISEHLANRLCAETSSKMINITVRVDMANCQRETCTRAVDTLVSFGNKRLRLEVLVLPQVVDNLVLGLDFLMGVGATIDCAGPKLKLHSAPGKIEHSRVGLVHVSDDSTEADVQEISSTGRISSPEKIVNTLKSSSQQCQCDVQYGRGKQNIAVDASSRHPMCITSKNIPERNEVRKCNWYEKMTNAVTNQPDKFPEYYIKNQRLYRHIPTILEGGTPWKLCVPIYSRGDILKECHDMPTAGHLSKRKTMARVTSTYYWPGLFRQVSSYLRSCIICQRYKCSQQKPAGRMFSKLASQSLNRQKTASKNAKRLQDASKIRQNLATAAQVQSKHNLHRQGWEPKVRQLVLNRTHPPTKVDGKFPTKLTDSTTKTSKHIKGRINELTASSKSTHIRFEMLRTVADPAIYYASQQTFLPEANFVHHPEDDQELKEAADELCKLRPGKVHTIKVTVNGRTYSLRKSRGGKVTIKFVN